MSPSSDDALDYPGAVSRLSRRQLRFIETRWGVEVPNLSRWRGSVTGDLMSTLVLGATDTTVPALPTTSAQLPLVLRECDAEEDFQIGGGDAPQPSPARSMPGQETR